MTVPSEVNRNEYTGTGSLRDYEFDFKIFTDSELVVSVADDDGTDISDDYVLDTDYTVTINDDDTGGYITLTTELPADYTLVLTPGLEITQNTSINPQGGFDPAVVENALDRLTVICKQLQEQLDRAVKIAITSETDVDDYLTDAQTAATAAAASAAAAATAETNAETAETNAETAETAAEAALAATLVALAAAETMGDMTDEVFEEGTDFTENVTTQLTLSKTYESESNLWVWFDGAMQGPDTYSLSGTTLTFSSVIPTGTLKVYVKGGSTLPLGALVDNSVTTSKIVDGDVTTAKLDDLAVTTGKIAAAAVTLAKLATDITPYFGDGISGCTLANGTDANNDINFGAGFCIDSTRTYGLRTTSTMVKQLDAAFAAGTAAGGLFSGAKANSTVYHCFRIRKDSDGTIDHGFDTSVTAANIPAGYTYYRRLASIYTDSSGNIVGFINYGDVFDLKVGVTDISVTTPGTAAVTATLASIPTGVQMYAKIRPALSDSSTTFSLVTPLDITNTAPSSSHYTNAVNANSQTHAAHLEVRTNTSAQVRYRLSASPVSGFTIRTQGWVDLRAI
jgi:hypothetical protein